MSLRRALITGITGTEVGFDGEVVWDTSKPNGQPARRPEAAVERA